MVKTNIFIGVPSHTGQVSICTQRCILEARGPDLAVRVRNNTFSLLDYNFDLLFCSAWASGADYFCLLHNDIAVSSGDPARSWLMVMLDALRDGGFAAVSVVAPIKSVEGITSTALQLTKNNSFTMRRLMLRELPKLPPIITKADVCKLWGLDAATAGALYINTGCLLMDLKKFGWAQKRWPGFQIRSQLAWSREGLPKAFVLSEDWRFSQHLAEYGWPYAAVGPQLLPVEHLGELVFRNTATWGDEEDLEGPKNPSFGEWEANEQVAKHTLVLEGGVS